MLHLVKTDRTYPPEVVATMTDAFDNACQSLSLPISNDVKQTLARAILHHVDKGEHSPTRLAAFALQELAASNHDRSVA